MKRFQVIRTHLSPYQKEDFFHREKAMIEGIPGLTYETLETRKEQATILITNTHSQLSSLPGNLLHRTSLIVHPNSGYDHFAPDMPAWKHIPMVIGHTIRAHAVAEYSLGALFAGLQEMPQHLSWVPKRSWDRALLQGTPVWIFGYGHIGKILAEVCFALGMKVTVIDPFIQDCKFKHHPHWQQGNLQEAKVVIAASSLNPSSFEMFNEDFFSHASPQLLFINGARGKLVREKALKDFLLSHPEAFAFLDVFHSEPFGEEWHGFPQVWKTSHIAGVEKNLDDKILQFEQEVLSDYLSLDDNSFHWKYQNELLQNKWINGMLT